MKLFFRRQAIYFKNHINAIPFILAVLSLIVFTLGIYVFTPLDVLLTTPRWPWAQGDNDPKAPLTMIQFFAVLASMLSVVALMNYRTKKTVLMGVVFYFLAGLQVVNDIYYIYEVNRFVLMSDNFRPEDFSTVNDGLIFSWIHLILISLAIILLILSPIIQKHTSKIKLKPISNQDKDLC